VVDLIDIIVTYSYDHFREGLNLDIAMKPAAAAIRGIKTRGNSGTILAENLTESVPDSPLVAVSPAGRMSVISIVTGPV
jgi:hypothetical protein